jgi:hypothetical protein
VRAVSNRNSDPPDSSPDSEKSLSELSLEDTLDQKMRGLPVKTRIPGGYNPYDAMAQGKSKQAPRKPTDLRKLSEWIRVQRQVADLKKRED